MPTQHKGRHEPPYNDYEVDVMIEHVIAFLAGVGLGSISYEIFMALRRIK